MTNAEPAKEAPWKAIALRKQQARLKALQTPDSIRITVPQSLLPHDPPQPKDGPQPVIHIPDQLLSAHDRHITSLPLPTLLLQLRNAQLTSTEVTSAYIRRASLTHQLCNSLTEPLFSRALDHAARLDSKLKSSGTPVGPLHGLPITVKDTFHVAGYDSSTGLASLCFKPARTTAPLVQLLESLGCVVVGKTNIPQTLASLDSVNNVFGRTYNPFNRLMTAGGSSGGEGVMVAMRGCAVGVGTDIGGSIRVPAMCNGVVGFKPSNARWPYGGQAVVGLEGVGRVGVQAVAGPIARCVADAELLLREVGPLAGLWGEDCAPVGVWRTLEQNGASELLRGSGERGEFVVGVLRSDGNCTLLPPIEAVIDEVSRLLSRQGSAYGVNLKVVDVPTPRAWTRAQSVMNKLMNFDGGVVMSPLLLETGEPLVPWMEGKFKHGGKPISLERAAEFQTQRRQLEKEFLEEVWVGTVDELGRKRRKIDALICAIAPHPVPEIERYNAAGYTSSWVMFDYPAGTIPVREMREQDLKLGQALGGKVLSSWDEKNRELWDEGKTDRKVYLGTRLSVQVVTAKGEDEKLGAVMRVVEEAVKNASTESISAKL